jgi:hypothetical protein
MDADGPHLSVFPVHRRDLARSFSRQKEERRSVSSLYGKVVQRSITIFAIGLFLQLSPRFHFSTIK